MKVQSLKIVSLKKISEYFFYFGYLCMMDDAYLANVNPARVDLVPGIVCRSILTLKEDFFHMQLCYCVKRV